MNRSRRVRLVVAVLSLTLLAAGCSNGASGSRATLYASVDELAADSTSIVIGTVIAQNSQGDAMVSTLGVTNAPTNPSLGSKAPDVGPLEVGDAVEVRQDPASRPLLETGKAYVLWLTPTMLPGDAADQYFITGSIAGAYILEGDTARRVATDTGDTLPETISVAGAP